MSIQIVTDYVEKDLDKVLGILNKIKLHLTAAVISNDLQFVQKILGETVNGVTFIGTMGRTTGAPPNMYFGCGNDPRACGASSPEGVLYTWTCHREIVMDIGPAPKNWKTPPPS